MNRLAILLLGESFAVEIQARRATLVATLTARGAMPASDQHRRRGPLKPDECKQALVQQLSLRNFSDQLSCGRVEAFFLLFLGQM